MMCSFVRQWRNEWMTSKYFHFIPQCFVFHSVVVLQIVNWTFELCFLSFFQPKLTATTISDAISSVDYPLSLSLSSISLYRLPSFNTLPYIYLQSIISHHSSILDNSTQFIFPSGVSWVCTEKNKKKNIFYSTTNESSATDFNSIKQDIVSRLHGDGKYVGKSPIIGVIHPSSSSSSLSIVVSKERSKMEESNEECGHCCVHTFDCFLSMLDWIVHGATSILRASCFLCVTIAQEM